VALIRSAAAEFTTVNVALPVGETVAITSDPLLLPTGTVEVAVLAWAQVTTGGGTTTVTPRVRRGTTVADPLVGEANAEAIKAAAGQTEPFSMLVREALAGGVSVQYVFTLQPAGAAGTMLQAFLAVLAIK